MATVTSPNPRWKQLIASSIKAGIKDDKSILYYTLTTSSLNADGIPTPHARTVVHRGFLNEQRSSSSPSGVEPFDPSFGSNEILMTTTDVRSPKAEQIRKTGNGKARGEIAWWMESANLQFRISGTLHLLPSPSHPTYVEPPSSLSPPPASPSSNPGTFNWSSERTRIFNKLSPGLLASFARPTPGSSHPNAQQLQKKGRNGPGVDGEEGKDDVESPWPLELPAPGKEENEEQKRLLKESEKNFALLLLLPESVDVVDLTRDRRSHFVRAQREQGKGLSGEEQEEEEGGWVEKRVVP